MATRDDLQLRIMFDGEAPGLEVHRLSLSAFGKPLHSLLLAFRRIASGMITQALDDPRYGGRGGKYAKEAQAIDLEIKAIGHGCVELDLVCSLAEVPAGDTRRLFSNGFLERAARRLLDSIQAESNGELSSQRVRDYLSSLPPGVSVQRYSLSRGGNPIHEISVGSVTLPVLPAGMAHLGRIDGTVVGLSFAPSAPEVRIRAGESVVRTAATDEQVEAAWSLRDRQVTAKILKAGAAAKLLWLRAADGVTYPSAGQATEHIMTRWHDLLQHLAQ